MTENASDTGQANESVQSPVLVRVVGKVWVRVSGVENGHFGTVFLPIKQRWASKGVVLRSEINKEHPNWIDIKYNTDRFNNAQRLDNATQITEELRTAFAAPKKPKPPKFGY